MSKFPFTELSMTEENRVWGSHLANVTNVTDVAEKYIQLLQSWHKANDGIPS